MAQKVNHVLGDDLEKSLFEKLKSSNLGMPVAVAHAGRIC